MGQLFSIVFQGQVLIKFYNRHFFSGYPVSIQYIFPRSPGQQWPSATIAFEGTEGMSRLCLEWSWLSFAQGSDLISVVDFIYHGEVEVEKDSLYDFLAIGEKLKLKGLAKTPEHSASQVKKTLIRINQLSMMLHRTTALAAEANPPEKKTFRGCFSKHIENPPPILRSILTFPTLKTK